jgi:hypothetical protein
MEPNHDAKQAAMELVAALLTQNPYHATRYLAEALNRACIPTLGRSTSWQPQRITELVREIKARKVA